VNQGLSIEGIESTLTFLNRVKAVTTMTLRTKWEFEYTAKALADAAVEQRHFRDQRVLFWTEKKQHVMEKIKAEGLTIDESLSDQLSIGSPKYGHSGGRGATVLIDATMQADLDECVQKIRTHTDYSKQYDAWVQLLLANPESRVRLDHDDWLFFFGKK
jgi:hypothetical protein